MQPYTTQDYGYMLVSVGTILLALVILGFLILGIVSILRTLIEYRQAKQTPPAPVIPPRRSTPQRTRYTPRHTPVRQPVAQTVVERRAGAYPSGLAWSLSPAETAARVSDEEFAAKRAARKTTDDTYRDKFGADPWRWTAATEIRR